MMKKFSVFTILALLLATAFAGFASAGTVPVTISRVWLNDVEVSQGQIRGDFLSGDELPVRVELNAIANGKVRVEVEVEGPEDEDDMEAETELFEVEAGQSYVKNVLVEFPSDLETGIYAVRISVTDRTNDEVVWTATIDVNRKEHSLRIDDVTFSPGLTVQAGRSLLATVRVENNGAEDEEDVKVTLSVEGVGQDVDYIDEIDEDDEEDSEELYLKLNECLEAGDYQGLVVAEFRNGRKQVEEEFTLHVTENPRCGRAEGRTTITVGPESQNIVAGGNEAVYPVSVTNQGSESRTYTLGVAAGDWAATRLSSNVLVVAPGETKVAYAYVAANSNAQSGEKSVNVAVKSNDVTLKDVALKANVVAAGGVTSARDALTIGLVVLVVLLVIVGLIVGFTRMRSGEEGKEEETYY